MLFKSLIALILLFVLTQSNFQITIKCGYYSCPSGCSQCQVLDGGPFSRYTTCVDAAGGCDSGNTFNISFTCNGCITSGTDCSYTVDQTGYYPYTGCTNSYDTYWQSNFKYSLNQLYSKSTSYIYSSYSWCSSACTSTSLSTVVIIVIVVGAVLICAVVGFLVNRRAQKRRANAALLAQNGNYSPIVY